MDVDFATAWEEVAELFPNRKASISDGKAVSWNQFEHRASQIASLLMAHGLGKDSKVGLYLHNSSEYLETSFGAFKIEGCPINVNYRYKAEELVYLLDNADAEAVFFQSCYAMRIWEIKDRLPKVKVYVQIDDGTEALLKGAIDYERSIRSLEAWPRQMRSAQGIYMLYTGGTTGLPKGVMYEVGAFAGRFIDMVASDMGLDSPDSTEEYRQLLSKIENPPVALPACPLMHGTGMWLGGFLPLLSGGCVVTTSTLGLNPDLLLSMVETHRVTDLVIVGDVFAKPILDSLDFAEKRNDPFDLSSLQKITSSGVMWSEAVKQGLLHHQDLVLTDIMGSTEGGMGSSVTTRGGSSFATAKFDLGDGVIVISDDGAEVKPGSGQVGRLATSASVPLGYFKDPEKSKATFIEMNGLRYSLPGDYATVEEDGTITLLGRGSVCINTAGEKVFPEEVEEVVKKCEGVTDCLVVGIPDERFGERVIAVVSSEEDFTLEEPGLIDFSKERLAGYKVPKGVVFVVQVRRGPNGKGDYKWAKEAAIKYYG